MIKNMRLISCCLYKAIIFICLLSSCSSKPKTDEFRKNESQIKLNYFYDFEFHIEFHRNPIGVKGELIYDFKNMLNDKDSMLVTHNVYAVDDFVRLEEAQKTEYVVTKSKMNRIYSTILEYLMPYPKENIYYKSNSFYIDMTSEWEACKIEFFMGRGLGYIILNDASCLVYTDVLAILNE